MADRTLLSSDLPANAVFADPTRGENGLLLQKRESLGRRITDDLIREAGEGRELFEVYHRDDSTVCDDSDQNSVASIIPDTKIKHHERRSGPVLPPVPALFFDSGMRVSRCDRST
jgi:hypothetical protein